MSRKWFLVSTYSGAEWVAFTTLLDRGIPAFYPRTIRNKRAGRWPQAAFSPQFPGYLFAGLDPGSSVETIKRVIGVREIVRNGSDVIMISPSEISSFRKQWLKEWRAHVPRRRVVTPIRIGEVIAIPSGAFADMPARIIRIDKSGRAIAQLGNLEVSFHVSALQKTVVRSAKHAPRTHHPQHISA